MRYFIIALLLLSPLSFAQEKYHNEEFGFTFKLPSGWQAKTEDELTDKQRNVLGLYAFLYEFFVILNPLDTEPSDFPTIIVVMGNIYEGSTTSEVIAGIESGKKKLVESTENMKKTVLGKKINIYSEIDTFYNYAPSCYRAVCRILYKIESEEVPWDTYAAVAQAKIVGRKRVIRFKGFYSGENPVDFQESFVEVANSFEFDLDAAPKKGLGTITQEIKDVSELSRRYTFKKISIWVGWILTASIILGFAKMVYGRWR